MADRPRVPPATDRPIAITIHIAERSAARDVRRRVASSAGVGVAATAR